LQNKRYREISTLMRRRIGKGKYSRRACIDRLQDLADGTAVVPIEQDPDATTRRAKTMEMIEQRRNERRNNAQKALEEIEKKLKAKEDADRAKAEARAKAEREMSEKATATEALRLKRELRKQELLEIKEAKEAKKNKTQAQKDAEAKEKLRLKEEEKAAKIEERRAAREKAKLDLETRRMQKALADHEAKVKMIRTKAIALEIVKKQMLEIVAPNVVRRASAPSKKAVAKAAAPKKTPVKAAATPKKTIVKKVATPKARATPKKAIKKTPATKKSPARAKGKGKVIDSADANNIEGPTHTPNGDATDNEADEIISIPVSGITSNSFTISMTSASVDSPRKIMLITALKDLCLKRELKMKPGANKDDLLKQLKSDDLNKGHEVLKDICRKRKLIIGGSKPVMAERIANDDAAIWQRKIGVESGAKKSESARKKVTFIGVVSDSDGANGTTTQGSSRDAVIVIDDETTTSATVNSATNNEDMDIDDSKAIDEQVTDAVIDDTVVNSLATNADNDTTPAMADAAASKHDLISGSINTHTIIDDNARDGASANDAGESHDEDIAGESVYKIGNSTAADNVEMAI
jgi:colicin import membrane protein